MLTALSLISGTAAAHDLWLVPDACVPTAGQVGVELQLGSSGVPEERRPVEAARSARYELLVAGGTVVLPPALDRVPVPPGKDAVIVLDRTPAHADLPPDRFAHYIEEELHAVPLAARASGAPVGGREDYTRHLKLLVGDGGDAWSRVTGQAYEIVPLRDPRTVGAGETLRARVLLNGQPARDVRVQAMRGLPAFGALAPATSVAITEARTDAQGEVSLVLPGPGLVLLRSVHLEACPACADADWRSWWTAFTFCAGGGTPER